MNQIHFAVGIKGTALVKIAVVLIVLIIIIMPKDEPDLFLSLLVLHCSLAYDQFSLQLIRNLAH